MRLAKHCRFHFNHFVKLWLPGRDDGDSGKKQPDREVTIARTGKDLVLPRSVGSEEPNQFSVDDVNGEPVPLKPTRKLGPSVCVHQGSGKEGLVIPIRWNPVEGSSNGPAQVSIRGNLDYQNMQRTFCDGFWPEGRDDLRDPAQTEGELAAAEAEEDARFEEALPGKVAKAVAQRKARNWEPRDVLDIEEDIRRARHARRASLRRGGLAQRFKRRAKSVVVECMKNCIQVMFYACDYSTKPNMTCAPLLVAIRDGIHRLEEELQAEEEDAKAAALADQLGVKNSQSAEASVAGSDGKVRRVPTKLEDEARRRLLRQASAANKAVVKGNCLMAMQLLTGREVLRSHYPWQLLMKHSMWMALQHRRERQGFDERAPDDDLVTLDAAEASSSQGEGDASGDSPCVSESSLSDVEDDDLVADSHGAGVHASAGGRDAEAQALAASSPAADSARCVSAATALDEAHAVQGSPDEPTVEDSLMAPAEPPAASHGSLTISKQGQDPPAGGSKVRLRNDTFYDDYLHRGDVEEGEFAVLFDTPLRHMAFYDYGMYVKVVSGDPVNLLPNQYPFATHHAKYHDYVQELRQHVVIRYICGFTMPTKESDAETNACFKQVLLRPHHCRGPAHCKKVGHTASFCECCSSGSQSDVAFSFAQPWRRFHAEQLSLAQAADELVLGSRKLPTLNDTTALRQWWHENALRGGFVHEKILPLLSGHERHPLDAALHGTSARRRALPRSEGGKASAERQAGKAGTPGARLVLLSQEGWMWGRFFVRKELDLQEVWSQGNHHGEKFSFEVSGQRTHGGSSDGK